MAKELLVEPRVKRGLNIEEIKESEGLNAGAIKEGGLNLLRSAEYATTAAATEAEAKNENINLKSKIINVISEYGTLASKGLGSAIIGGGCCVHLSVEYMPANPASKAMSEVLVIVADSEGTVLGWGKEFQGGYHVKECIISTNPGARLIVTTSNAIARVRWCEVFSC